MTTYIVGDIQGCLDPLLQLMGRVQFDPQHDQLWSVGDVINRGPRSLDTLRFLKSLGPAFKMVLGNHDLHFLAIYHGAQNLKKSDTLQDLLDAPDCDALAHWLLQQPLIICMNKTVLVHAGVPAIWSIEQACALACEVETALKDQPLIFFQNMYGNKPASWNENLSGMERLRAITNYLTRMRIITHDGLLDLNYKKGLEQICDGYQPWFSFERLPADQDAHIYFGHWASLPCKTYKQRFHALDSGCVWGNHLTLLCLESGERITSNAANTPAGELP